MSIEAKIRQYLEQELAAVTDPREQENRQEVINYLKDSKGECSGLSTMWAYGRMTAAPESETFFNQTNKLLLNWDGEKKFSGKEKEDVERFVADVIFYQRGQLMFLQDSVDLLQSSPDADGREFQQSYKTERAFLPKDLLQDRLEKIIQPNAMIFLSASVDEDGHRVALYQKSQDDKIYYYNSNNAEEMSFSAVRDLTDRVWEDNKRSNLKKTDIWGSINVADFKIDQMLRELKVDVVQFVGDQYSKPSQFSPSAAENESFLQSKGGTIAGLMNNDMMQRHFLSLDMKSQISLIDGASENKEIFVKLLVNDLLKVNPNNQHVTDPAIADYLLKDQKAVIQSLVAKNLLPKEAPQLLCDKPELLYGLSRTFEKACHQEDFDKVKSLVKMGIKIKQNNISTLIEKDQPEIISFLLAEQKLDLYNFQTVRYEQPRPNFDKLPDRIDKFDCGNSHIVYAARIGAMENLKLMVSQLDKDKEKENKIILGEALYWSCNNGHQEAAKFLLENGAPLEATKFDRTPLVQACRTQNVKMAQLLLENGADPKAYSNYKETELHRYRDNTEIKELLSSYSEGKKDQPSTRNIAVTSVESLCQQVRAEKNGDGVVENLREKADDKQEGFVAAIRSTGSTSRER